MKVNIQGTFVEFRSDFDFRNLEENSRRGWKVSAGDYFKFPVDLGGSQIFVKRFQKKKDEISGFLFITSILGKKLPGLPCVYDWVSINEGGKEVHYLFMEFIQGETLDNLHRSGLKIKPKKIANDLIKALDTVFSQGFWYPDFDPKNILMSRNGDYYLIDLDSTYSQNVHPRPSLYGSKDYWAPIYEYCKLYLPYVDLKSLRGDVLNSFHVVYLLALYSFYANNVSADLTARSISQLNAYLLSIRAALVRKIYQTCFHPLPGFGANQSRVPIDLLQELIKEALFPKSEELDVCLGKESPQILFFSAKEQISIPAQGHKSYELSWAIKNSRNIFVTHLGKVDSIGSAIITISKSQDYMLIAQNPKGREERTLHVRGEQLPIVKYFSANNQSAKQGEDIEFRWHVENSSCVYLQLDGKPFRVPSKGIFKISVSQKFTAKLQCKRNETSVEVIEKSIDVNVLLDPKIVKFDVDKQVVISGAEVCLSWEVKNASRVTLLPMNVDVTNQSDYRTILEKDTTFFLIVRNAVSIQTAQTLVRSIERPIVTEFKVKKQSIEFGASTEIAWNVKKSASVQLSFGSSLTDVDPIGSRIISPSRSQQYRLIVTALDRVTRIEELVTVDVIQPVSVRQFKSEESYLQKGQSTYLTWQVDNATDLTILPEDVSVTGLDKLKVSPKQTTIYTLTAKNALHSVSKTYKVDVGHATTPVWKPLSGLLVVIILLLAGWFYSGYHKRKLAVAEVHRLLVQGQETAFTKCSIAETAFRQAFKLNLSLPPEYRSDSIAILSEHYNAEGDRRCHAYGRIRQDISYIIDCNYKLAAALRGSTEPKTCK